VDRSLIILKIKLMDGLDWIHPFVLFYFLMDGLNEFIVDELNE